MYLASFGTTGAPPGNFQMTFSRRVLTVIAVLALGAGPVFAAETGGTPAKPDVPPQARSADLQKLMDAFSARRDSLLADRKALLDQLKTATAEQRKDILDKLQSEQKDVLDAQRALAKQIRDEIRKLRETRPDSRH